MAGKILRIRLDGSIPKDNPFPNSPIYSWGHRNPQGFAWHPRTKQFYSSEHGQLAHDEINLIKPGANYGWPIIEGDEQLNSLGSHGDEPFLELPLIHSGEETWAPSGMTFITQGPWEGQLLVSNLRGSQIIRLILNEAGDQVIEVDSLLKNEYGRIRDVVEAPDGTLYILTNNRDGRGNPGSDDDRIFQLSPRLP